MFIDEADIIIQAGDGGAGKVAFFVNRKGPCGGNGGKGGNLYFVVNQNITDLKKFTQTISFKAENGRPGCSNRRGGLSGKDLILQIPPNTTIVDKKTEQEITLTESNSKVLVCHGGNGGMGNDSFKTSTNRTPHKATPGESGEKREVKLILKLIADYGLIGLPNAGKSSLLNKLTNATAKIASYPFTTLEPNLGVVDGKVLADIPGLIAGASAGKGLGIRFLKHIEKVSLILHCISVESENIEKDYDTVNGEIGKYNKSILEKKIIILLTKTDLAHEKEIDIKIKILKKYGKPMLPVSIYNEESLEMLRNAISI